MSKRLQKVGESRLQYLTAARRYAARKFNELRENNYHHFSHDVVKALELTEKRFVDLGTCGVEGTREANGRGEPDIDYLNSGDQYEITLYHYKRRFCVGCVGDIFERYAGKG